MGLAQWIAGPGQEFIGGGSEVGRLPSRSNPSEVARRGPPANDDGNPAASEDPQHGAPPVVIRVRRLHDPDPVAVSAGNFDRPGDAGHFNCDFPLLIDATAPLKQFGPDHGGVIVIIAVSTVPIRLVAIGVAPFDGIR